MTQTTIQTQSPTTLNMGVSQSILKKAPRFFGSPQSILTEFQRPVRFRNDNSRKVRESLIFETQHKMMPFSLRKTPFNPKRT